MAPSYYTNYLGPVSVGRVLICKACHTYIASMEQFLSRSFSGTKGSRAGLFEDASNVALGERQVWLMMTGAHTVRKMACLGCDAYVGWRFVRAHEKSEQWKTGAYVLERDSLLVKSVFDCDADLGDRAPTPHLKLKAVTDLAYRHKRRPLVET